jgi:hypothetical protein
MEEALQRRVPKEQGAKPLLQRAVETGVGVVGGGVLGLGVGDGNPLLGALAGGALGSRGKAGQWAGRKAQRVATGAAIKSAQKASNFDLTGAISKGRAATEAAESAAITNPMSAGIRASGQAGERPAPEDLSTLNNDELTQEIAYSSGILGNPSRYSRAIRELQNRRR